MSRKLMCLAAGGVEGGLEQGNGNATRFPWVAPRLPMDAQNLVLRKFVLVLVLASGARSARGPEQGCGSVRRRRYKSLQISEKEMAEAPGNRTQQGRLPTPPNGFEER